jgi:A/G-specific adenine glycosylase
MSSKDELFINKVLLYYKKMGRHDLPWRKGITSYKILISEIMLQQTQVARVLVKYKEWMKKYPTLSSLSCANLTDILKLWQGLGYQRRAKALFEISKGFKKIPKSYEELLKLPGIGPYTASAICAFAYNTFPPHLVETNIRTVLIEEFHAKENKIKDEALYMDLKRLEKNKKVQALGARDWYYALMDYGAYLKTQKVSHNTMSSQYAKQTPYKGSLRELRAKTLFAIAHRESLPIDGRLEVVTNQLLTEGYIVKSGKRNQYSIK